MATIVLGLRLVLAAVFITAGVGKLLDLSGSRRAMVDFGVPERAARLAGTVLPVVELAIGVTLIFRPSARWAAIGALLLLLAFIAGIAHALARGEQPDCHCFGQIHSAPAEKTTLIRNGLLAAAAAVVVAYGSGPAVDTWVNARSAAELVAVGAVVAFIAAIAYALTLRSKIETLTGDLSTARQLASMGRSGIPVGIDAPAFALKSLDGETVTLDALRERGLPVLLVFMSPWCGPCEALMPKVGQWQRTLIERLTIALISVGTAEQNADKFADHGYANVLLQDETEVTTAYHIGGTPSAVLVSPEGKVASHTAEAEPTIEPLVRVALRHGVPPLVEGSVA